MNILVTGFGPFGDITGKMYNIYVIHLTYYIIENPSEVYAREVKVSQATVLSRIITVNHVGLEDFARFISSIPTGFLDAIIHLGVDASEPDFKLEITASNLLASKGHGPEGRKRLLTTCNMSSSRWATFLAQYSFDAGSYYCNQLYYSTLTTVYNQPLTRKGSFLPVIFVHVPTFEAIPLEVGLAELKDIIAAIIATSCI